MKAYMSNRERRADLDWFDAQPRPTVGLGQFCQDEFPGGGFQAEDIWHAAALREARAILAETAGGCAVVALSRLSEIEIYEASERHAWADRAGNAHVSLVQALEAFINS